MKFITQQTKLAKWLVLSLFSVALLYLSFITKQSDFFLLFPAYSIAFISYLLLLRNSIISLKEVIAIGIILRISLIFSIPTFSDDIYRYIWDGMLSANGFNPFGFTPRQFLELNPDFSGSKLFPLLNSQEYYSVYPLIPQCLFYISGLFSFAGLTTQILIIKALIIGFEIGTVLLLPRLLNKLNLNPIDSAWYILNPLILIELNSNAHVEGIMIFSLIAAGYLYQSNKIFQAYSFYIAAIISKIIPLLLAPFIFFKINKKYRLGFALSCCIATTAVFLPAIISGNSVGILSSLRLYFDHFEFNASIYYAFRYFGELLYGYNIIHTIGPALSIFSGLVILYLSFRKQSRNLLSLSKTALSIMTIYFLFSTTIHPWYISTLILISTFNKLMFPVLWSLLIYLSYYNYSGVEYLESIPIVILEYSLLLAYIAYESGLFKNITKWISSHL